MIGVTGRNKSQLNFCFPFVIQTISLSTFIISETQRDSYGVMYNTEAIIKTINHHDTEEF